MTGSSLRSRREWVPARTSVPNASAKSRSGREKNGEESCWIPACSKTMLSWIVSSPANYYFHWLRAVTHQSNVNRYLSQGRTSVRRDATLRYCHDINQNGEDEGKYWEGVEFAKYTERKEGDYSERRTREGRCGITFRERRFGYTTDRFRKKFDLYDLCFGEHRFVVCEDVCISHLHSILHFSCTDIWRPPRVRLKTFTAVIYEFLKKSPNFCFRLLRQSLHTSLAVLSLNLRPRFKDFFWRICLHRPSKHSLVCCYMYVLLCDDFVIFPPGPRKGVG